MKTIIVVATCKKLSKTQAVGEFAFNGYYAGEEIRRLSIYPPRGQGWEIGEDYVIFVQVLITQNTDLIGLALKYKKLSEVFSKS